MFFRSYSIVVIKIVTINVGAKNIIPFTTVPGGWKSYFITIVLRVISMKNVKYSQIFPRSINLLRYFFNKNPYETNECLTEFIVQISI